MSNVAVIGGGLAGSEAALALGRRGFTVTLYEMRPRRKTPVHRSEDLAELVCSNSFKSMRPDSAAGMLKRELEVLGSPLYGIACDTRIPAGGALAVDREAFSGAVTAAIEACPFIEVVREEVTSLMDATQDSEAVIVATGPLTSDALAADIASLGGEEELSFFDAAAPIVMAESLDPSTVFRQSRYEDAGQGDYLNAPLSKEEYAAFIEALLSAPRVVVKEFETKELFQACQPIEEIARAGFDAPRFGCMKPVGLIDPRTGRRPYAAVQLRAENAQASSYNLVGFQTNLTFPAQREVFRRIPGLEQAEFARYGVMHRNTFLNAPRLVDLTGRLKGKVAGSLSRPVYIAGQLSGTEGYCEAIRSGLHCAISVSAQLEGAELPELPATTAFGALMHHATDPSTVNYQPMHVNFGILPGLAEPVRNKRKRYEAYAKRGEHALVAYARALDKAGLGGVR